MRSVMQHNFSQVPSVQIPRSVFNRSHGYKTTFDQDYLVPIFVDEALPGDTFNLNTTFFARLATPTVPYMDNLYLDTFYFAVPYRLVWGKWKQFMGEQDSPDTFTEYLVPQLEGAHSSLSLGDYFGLPIDTEISVSALPFRAYNLIWNEWFRDQNLQPLLDVEVGNGPDDPIYYSLMKRNKRHDYFTSALPWPQKGDAVTIGVTGNIPVVGNGQTLGLTFDPEQEFYSASLRKMTENNAWLVGHEGGGHDLPYADYTPVPDSYPNTQAGNNAYGVDPRPEYSGLIGLLSEANATTINHLREAFQLQRMLERDARGGSRYTEIIRSHFGVISPDARQQRPEYLGGSTTRISVTPVQQTSNTTDDEHTPQGNLAAFSQVADTRGGFVKSFTEHSIIIGLANVRADITYSQGLNRMWSRKSRYDFYWPSLAHLGEQEILNKEIYVDGTEDDEKVFGYQERFAEYRYFPSQLTGLMRPSADLGLTAWSLSENFTTRPQLSSEFIVSNTPLDRVSAVTTQPKVVFDAYFDLKCARPMPTYSVPGLIDHF